MAIVNSTILIANLHCSSCVNTIRETLLSLNPPPLSLNTSIVSQTVTVEHPAELTEDAIKAALDEAGFDLVSTPEVQSYQLCRSSLILPDILSKKRRKHAEQCLLCREEAIPTHNQLPELKLKGSSVATSYIESLDLEKADKPVGDGANGESTGEMHYTATFSVGGMTCASCVGTVTRAASEIPGVSNVAVSLVGKSASANIENESLARAIVEAVEDGGYECEIISCEPIHNTKVPVTKPTRREQGPYRATFSVGGMTCASCVSTIRSVLQEIKGVSDISINLVGNSAAVVLDNKGLVENVVEAIEDGGYEAKLFSIESASAEQDDEGKVAGPRTISLKVDGMFCRHCPTNIMQALSKIGDKIKIEEPLKSHNDPKSVIKLSYTPSPPDFTIRNIIQTIAMVKSPPFEVSIVKPPSLEERARIMHAQEQRILLYRLISAIVLAIPTFIIGIVYMILVPAANEIRMWFMHPIWAGNASRAQWALFILATPAMFYSAAHFHRRSIKEIYGLWRRGSKTPLLRRFVRFGSMNLLVSLGVTIAYFASIALLALATVQSPSADGEGDEATYFDTVVFLSMFLLAGRYLEAYSKGRTADAVTALGNLRPSETLLLVPATSFELEKSDSNNTDLEKGLHEDSETIGKGMRVQKVNVDLLEIGDIVRVPHGATPPMDGIIVSKEGSQFDESSLTGESRAIKKDAGDQVFVGTINRGKMVEVKIEKLGGETMLDQIVKVVREGQTKRAPIEKFADVITGFFVPIITLLAISTWIIWLALGLSGALPESYLDAPIGGWPVWALEFAIAVFVVACPCGIGLAAPTALLVGSGLAAKFGILVRGGGEAFQEAAQLDIVVFDKTGTLTKGGDPKVTDTDIDTTCTPLNRDSILSIAHSLESASSHPLAQAVRDYCESQENVTLFATTAGAIEEKGGRGVKAEFLSPKCNAIIGNEKWVEEHDSSFSISQETLLTRWKSEGKNVIAVAIQVPSEIYRVVAIFAVSDELREESNAVIHALQAHGLGTWMISGDNPITAKAVAKTVGIPETNVIAGVLPHEKAEKVKWLQFVGKKRELSKWKQTLGMKPLNERCVVAMVGDGINDAPALSAADVGVAVGSGSDVAISSASFILIKSDLRSLLTLTDLSRKVFNRVKFNFVWAIMYNAVALPIAAGVIYPAGHARLDPVWASLAMALSSVSVVLSSLLLRFYREPRTRMN